MVTLLIPVSWLTELFRSVDFTIYITIYLFNHILNPLHHWHRLVVCENKSEDFLIMYNSNFLWQNQNILLRNYPDVLHWLCISATFENNFRGPHGDVALILRSINHFNVVYVAGAQAEPEYCANMHRSWIQKYLRRVTQEVWNDTECSLHQAILHSSITYLAFAEVL